MKLSQLKTALTQYEQSRGFLSSLYTLPPCIQTLKQLYSEFDAYFQSDSSHPAQIDPSLLETQCYSLIIPLSKLSPAEAPYFKEIFNILKAKLHLEVINNIYVKKWELTDLNKTLAELEKIVTITVENREFYTSLLREPFGRLVNNMAKVKLLTRENFESALEALSFSLPYSPVTPSAYASWCSHNEATQIRNKFEPSILFRSQGFAVAKIVLEHR